MLALSLLCLNCTNEDFIHYEKTKTGVLTSRTSLQDILDYGINDVNDFDVLRTNSIYPFTELSSTDFNTFKNNAQINSNNLTGETMGLNNYLTINQYKIWWKISNHENVILQNVGVSSYGGFLSDIQNEPIYSDYPGIICIRNVLPGNLEELVQSEKDCKEGYASCTYPENILTCGP